MQSPGGCLPPVREGMHQISRTYHATAAYIFPFIYAHPTFFCLLLLVPFPHTLLVQQTKRSGTVAWSPINQERGFIAVGTVANAIDDSFETTADLEVMSVDFSQGSGKEMQIKGAIKSNERFHRLAWSGLSAGSTTLPLGILAGGMVDGSIGFWNPAIISKQMQGEPLVARVQKHKGPVRGLDFNSFKPNLLASGATESEILIWDLANPNTPNVYTPGTPTQPLSDITCVAWNGKVEHILASTGVSGTSVVWDLRQKRPVISFTDSATRHVGPLSVSWSCCMAILFGLAVSCKAGVSILLHLS